MREIRPSGLAGGEAESIGLPYPDNSVNSPLDNADDEVMHLQTPDRRRGYRQKASALAILRPVNGAGEALHAHVFELSMHGVGLSVRQPLEIGSLFEFEMCDGRQSGSRIEIRSCRARADNMFDVGGQFC